MDNGNFFYPHLTRAAERDAAAGRHGAYHQASATRRSRIGEALGGDFGGRFLGPPDHAPGSGHAGGSARPCSEMPAWCWNAARSRVRAPCRVLYGSCGAPAGSGTPPPPTGTGAQGSDVQTLADLFRQFLGPLGGQGTPAPATAAGETITSTPSSGGSGALLGIVAALAIGLGIYWWSERRKHGAA